MKPTKTAPLEFVIYAGVRGELPQEIGTLDVPVTVASSENRVVTLHADVKAAISTLITRLQRNDK